jgi:hypothetical protein
MVWFAAAHGLFSFPCWPRRLLGSNLDPRDQVELIGAELVLTASSVGMDTFEAYRGSTIVPVCSSKSMNLGQEGSWSQIDMGRLAMSRISRPAAKRPLRTGKFAGFALPRAR